MKERVLLADGHEWMLQEMEDLLLLISTCARWNYRDQKKIHRSRSVGNRIDG